MRRILIPLAMVVFFSISASAETYIITGTATYSDNSQLVLQDISIDCEQSESQCRQFQGTTTQTDRYGNYTLAFSVDDDDDGVQILLSVKGEDFPHTINLDRLRANGGSITQNLRLSGDSTPMGAGFSSACCLLMFVIVSLYVVGKSARMLSTPAGRMEFRGYKPEKYVQCPVCDLSVPHHQLTKHLIVDHDIEMFEAGEMAGKVLRKTWSSQEE
ncbi:MAG: hypothetical protein VX366_07175 [Candidatus Thermoplasmatota archaeon]|nr:hypothetical protein [Candidatus Thermoplasmatota archaeon]